MTVGSSIDLELRNSVWYERGRFVFEQPYDDLEYTGVASASSLVVSGKTVRVTGMTGIDNVYWIASGDAAPAGTKVDLYFTGALTVNDGGNLALDGDFATAAGSVLGLLSIGAGGWVERFRREATTSRQATLGTGATPDVTGPYEILLTGNSTTSVTNMIGGVLGQVVTIENNNTLGTSPYYTNGRRTFEHEANTSDGYLSFATDADFGTLQGDVVTMRCMYDSTNAVNYWKELSRVEDRSVTPQIDVTAGGSLTIWRSRHILNNTSGGSVTFDNLLPAMRPGTQVTMFATTLNGGVIWSEVGNMRVYSGSTITLNQDDEMHVFLASSFPNTPAIKWVQIDHSQADIA